MDNGRAGALQSEIAASVEEAEALLQSNRSLSVAFLALRMDQRFAEVDVKLSIFADRLNDIVSSQREINKRIDSLEMRIDKASHEFKRLEKELHA